MSITVNLPSVLATHAGGVRTLRASGRTLGEAVADVAAQYPALGPRLRDKDGNPYPFVVFYLNDEDVRFRGGFAAPVQDGDEVTVIPAIAGCERHLLLLHRRCTPCSRTSVAAPPLRSRPRPGADGSLSCRRGRDRKRAREIAVREPTVRFHPRAFQPPARDRTPEPDRAGLPVHHALEVGAERMRPALVAHVPTGRDVPDRAGRCAGLLHLTQRDSQATPRRAFHRSLPGAVLAVGGHAGEHAVKRQPRLPACRGAIRRGWQHGADAGHRGQDRSASRCPTNHLESPVEAFEVVVQANAPTLVRRSVGALATGRCRCADYICNLRLRSTDCVWSLRQTWRLIMVTA